MADVPIFDENVESKIKKISEFLDTASLNKIINKLTDYAEIITAGKLSGIINYNYRLGSTQSRLTSELLIDIKALTKIYTIATKGSRDLEEEYISNIFSDAVTPTNISSYVSLRTTVENRLTHQVQQYNQLPSCRPERSLLFELNIVQNYLVKLIDSDRKLC